MLVTVVVIYLCQKNRTLDFISSIELGNPFFAMVAPPAPHAPYTPAERHEHLFPNVKALKTKNYNVPCGPLGRSCTEFV